MRRRLPPETGRQGHPPARLRHFDPADWPNPDCHPECAFWEARRAWRDEHPPAEDAPLGLVDGPDVPWHPEWI